MERSFDEMPAHILASLEDIAYENTLIAELMVGLAMVADSIPACDPSETNH